MKKFYTILTIGLYLFSVGIMVAVLFGADSRLEWYFILLLAMNFELRKDIICLQEKVEE